MSRRFVSLAVLTGVLAVALVSAQPPTSAPAQPAPGIQHPVLSTLRPVHPRLLVLDADLPGVRRQLAEDVHVRRWHDRLKEQASQLLAEPVVERTLVGPRLLTQSRTALHRISTLAGLFLIDGDPRVLARAKAEMRAVAAFSDWNPSHFLDVAELTAAMALGYDWLYSDLTPDERELFRAAIIAKGLKPGVDAIRAPSFWAAQGRNTWSEVCFGGLALGALAVAEHAPDLSASVLSALKAPAFSAHLRRFAPDGGDVEGPGYWGYSTMYLTFLLSALETALGNDLGLGQTEGLASMGQFRMYSIGPSGRQLNYADAVEEPAPAPQMFWMAGRYDRPEYAAHEHAWLARSRIAPSVFHVLWSARPPTRAASLPPTSARFRNVDVAVLRGDWRDALGSWVALKGGSNAATLGHLDLGSFVIDALGERWAIDPGPDYFDLPEYFGPRRWTYFRLGTGSHNTLLVDGQNQDSSAAAPIVAFGDDSYRAFAVTDLSAAYRPALTRARRGVALIDGRDVLIQDEIEGASATGVVWQMATRAQVTIVGRVATLRQSGLSATLQIVEPAGAKLLAEAAVIPAPQAPSDLVIVRVVLPAGEPVVRAVVWFTTGDRPPPAVTPLEAWQGNQTPAVQ
jgi:Heparinase II/III-like protein